MRKTSFGLGLAGTIVAFVIAFIMLAVAIVVTVVGNVGFDKMEFYMGEDELYFDKDEGEFDFDVNSEVRYYDEDGNELFFDMDDKEMPFDKDGYMDHMAKGFGRRFGGNMSGMPRIMLRLISGWLWFAAAALFVAGALGIIGTVITRRKKSTAAGVLLLVSAVLSVFSIYGLYASSLLIPSGILAFIKDKSEKEEPQA